MPFLAPLLLLIGCGEPVVAETAVETTVTTSITTEPTGSGCDKLIIEYYGEDEPVIGDTWTIWLKCDGVTMMGASVIQFDPLDFATLDENEVTFQREGTGILMMQTGSFQVEMTIVVGAK